MVYDKAYLLADLLVMMYAKHELRLLLEFDPKMS